MMAAAEEEPPDKSYSQTKRVLWEADENWGTKLVLAAAEDTKVAKGCLDKKVCKWAEQ